MFTKVIYKSSLSASEGDKTKITKLDCERQGTNAKMGSIEKEGGNMKRNERCDSFVLDVESLLHGADKEAIGSPRIAAPLKLQRSLSRKESQTRGERKAATAEMETQDAHKGGLGVVCKPENSVAVRMLATTTADANAMEGRFRRLSSSNSNRRSSWINPRRIFLFFATLSSMGTIILIYFTLSIGKTNGGGDDALSQ